MLMNIFKIGLLGFTFKTIYQAIVTNRLETFLGDTGLNPELIKTHSCKELNDMDVLGDLTRRQREELSRLTNFSIGFGVNMLILWVAWSVLIILQ